MAAPGRRQLADRGALAATVGAAAGWAVWRDASQAALVLQLPMYLGVPLGIVAGLVGGRGVRRTEPGAAPDRGT